MKGLIIWAQSDCRSMMGLYHEVRRLLSCPVVITLWKSPVNDSTCDLRSRVGFSSEEFADIGMIPVGESFERGLAVLDGHSGYSHLFAVYQGSRNFRRLIAEAKRRGENVGVISESPCNMSTGIKGWLKRNIYLPHVLPRKISTVAQTADFVINLSGDNSRPLRDIGWPAEKILPFGYFPPPIPGSRCINRNTVQGFHILVTGIMTWHRAPDTVLNALILLHKWGVKFRATFTQKGPLLGRLKSMSEKHGLPIEFPGFLPMPELIKLYETCSVYVAAGRSEPWGMRLNDALQCGAPLAVSRGMGGVKLVDEYGCGVAFDADDYVDLAHKLRRMIQDVSFYRKVAACACEAAGGIFPAKMAEALLKNISEFWNI